MSLYFTDSLVLVFLTNYGGMQAKPGARGLLLDSRGKMVGLQNAGAWEMASVPKQTLTFEKEKFSWAYK